MILSLSNIISNYYPIAMLTVPIFGVVDNGPRKSKTVIDRQYITVLSPIIKSKQRNKTAFHIPAIVETTVRQVDLVDRPCNENRRSFGSRPA